MTKMNFMNILVTIMLIIIMILISNYHIHPITMISLILIYSSFICIIMNLWSFNYIYSMLMFLIMISGILILFLYFASLISNEQHKISFYYITIMMSLTTLLMIYKSNMLMKFPHPSNDETSLLILEKCPLYYSFKLYNYPYNYMTFTCILFLLMSLFLIIKISSLKSSPLRKIK